MQCSVKQHILQAISQIKLDDLSDRIFSTIKEK